LNGVSRRTTMIKISDNYFIDRDKLNWILIEKKYRTAKAGKRAGEIVSEDTHHYFSNLKSLCLRVMDMEIDPTHGIADLNQSLWAAQSMITKAIDKHSAEVKAMFNGEGLS